MLVNKVDGKVISCGEIDIIAYHPQKNVLYFIEAKYLAPAKDPRAMGKVISDHFRQKKYHKKILSKIEWVKLNVGVIRRLFNTFLSCDIAPDCSFENYFITGNANAVKFLVKEYKIDTFFEFETFFSATNED